MNSELKQNFITYIFEELNRDEINYAILRNYSRLPEISGDDIDIYVERRDIFSFVSQYMDVLIGKLGWNYKVKYKSDNFISIVCYVILEDSIETLQLDFFNSFRWRGIDYIDTEMLNTKIIKYNDFKVLTNGAELALTSIKEFLGYGYLREKHEKRFKALISNNLNDFISVIPDCVRVRLAGSIIQWSKDDSENSSLKAAKAIKFSLIKSSFFVYLYNSSKSFGNLLSHLIRRKRLFVFLGPDGSGKTTLINNYRSVIDRFYPDNIVTYHRRYGIFPDLKTNKGLASMKGKVGPGKTKKVKRSFISKFVSIVVVLYYSLEYFLGNFIEFRNKFNGSLVLYDRYYFDHFLQPTSRDLIFPFRKFFLFFITKPTLIVHLKASSEEIYKRKQDLPEKEIKIQNNYIDLLLSDYSNVIRLDSVELNQQELVKALFVETIDYL